MMTNNMKEMTINTNQLIMLKYLMDGFILPKPSKKSADAENKSEKELIGKEATVYIHNIFSDNLLDYITLRLKVNQLIRELNVEEATKDKENLIARLRFIQQYSNYDFARRISIPIVSFSVVSGIILCVYSLAAMHSLLPFLVIPIVIYVLSLIVLMHADAMKPAVCQDMKEVEEVYPKEQITDQKAKSEKKDETTEEKQVKENGSKILRSQSFLENDHRLPASENETTLFMQKMADLSEIMRAADTKKDPKEPAKTSYKVRTFFSQESDKEFAQNATLTIEAM